MELDWSSLKLIHYTGKKQYNYTSRAERVKEV
jgi:hypothetical protein